MRREEGLSPLATFRGGLCLCAALLIVCRTAAPCAPSGVTGRGVSTHAGSPGCPGCQPNSHSSPGAQRPRAQPSPGAPSQRCPSLASPGLISRPAPGSGMNKSATLHNQGCRFLPNGCLCPAAAPALGTHLPTPRVSPGTDKPCPHPCWPAARRAVSEAGRGGVAVAGFAKDPQLSSPSAPTQD